MSGGLTVDGARLDTISGWLTRLATQVDVSGRSTLSGSGSSQVDGAAANADDWRRGASATAVRDVAEWSAALGDVNAVLGETDAAIGQAAPAVNRIAGPGLRAV